MGGFESSSQINRAGVRVDMIKATQHDVLADLDYGLLPTQGITTARDSLRWHLIDRGGCYDFSSLTRQASAAARHGVQTIWDLCHYGWPDDLDIYSPAFVERFARFCAAAARFLGDFSPDIPVYVPVNEISFLAYAVGEVGFVDPQVPGRGGELKRQLARAAIAGMEAIWEVDPRARFVHVDPLIHILPPRGRPELAARAAQMRDWQFEGWDILCGRAYPDVGGDPRYLDIIGANFYHDGQWELEGDPLDWAQTPRDERWLPLRALLGEVWERYRRPVFLSETSHFGAGRCEWLGEVVGEVCAALAAGVPVGGVCLYPILDRPDWNDFSHWHNSGLWDIAPGADGTLVRVLNGEYAVALRRAQQTISSALAPRALRV